MRTRTTTTLAALAAAGLLSGPARAETPASLKGLWKLVSYEVEARADGRTRPVMGEHPTGFAYFTPDDRVFFLLTGEGRKPAETDAERAALMKTLVSYTGKITLAGDQWTAKLDAAWDPKWVGTEQTRSFTIAGDRLRVLTPWRVMPNWADQGETRSIVTFERARD
ncbi:hypothetical protein ASF49_05665 [Methylobacterium sp. Leaf104]|uniref:lipocalin-like domain-containing protein n=1 Tax=Methylobacterium TaxID=407 RepID=UPI0006FEC0A4|nr:MULTISPECIES: lipocalin-like domain-containing protein [Methylobacterium]KQP38478.1 hypothetical protein ASF49_05665 [Methylobacterium sp. Leaf104]MCI9880101.1 lipocalin-like domain-containing protein [Methylobacterium goesingense]